MTRSGQLRTDAADRTSDGDTRHYATAESSARDLAGAGSAARSTRAAADALFDRDEVEGVLHGAFYARGRGDGAGRALGPKDRPEHYKVICISMYLDALSELDRMVTELKRRGFTKANRSALIRHALSMVDLDKVPRGL